MFVVLGLLVSLDQLTLNAVQTIEPELRQTFHISSGAVVFIASASSLFYALGAIPMGWLADRMKRVPIVGVATLVAALFTFLSGLAGSAFVLFWALCLTGVAKANNLAVHQPLLADNYPIGIRARMSAAMNIGQQVLGNLSPVVVGRDRDLGRRGRGLALGLLRARHPGRGHCVRRVLACGSPHAGSTRRKTSSARSSKTRTPPSLRWKRPSRA